MERTSSSEGELIDGRYRIVRRLGSGAMGSVFEVEDLTLENQRYALKLFDPLGRVSKKGLARFKKEAVVTRRAPHPNIVSCFDYGTTSSNQTYLVMELVEGNDLAEELETGAHGRLPVDFAISVLYQIASALSYAHSLGIVHRDVKPQNVLLGRDGTVKLADFGHATFTSGEMNLTMTEDAIGTPYYMSPEHFENQRVDARSDIYSLGILAYELVCGTKPYQGATYYAIAQQHLEEPLPDFPRLERDLPSWIREFIEKCTAKKPGKRFQRVSEICDLLSEKIKEIEGEKGDPVVRAVAQIEQLRSKLEAKRVRKMYYLSLVMFLLVFTALSRAVFIEEKAYSHWAGFVFGAEKVVPSWVLSPLRFLTGVLEDPDDTELWERIRRSEGDRKLKWDLVARIRAGVLEPTRPSLRPGVTIFEEALVKGNHMLVSEFLEHGADPDVELSSGLRIEHVLAQRGLVALLLKFQDKWRDTLDTKDREGRTPLIHSVLHGRYDSLRNLIMGGADPGLEDVYGHSALYYAALLGRPDHLRALLCDREIFNDGSQRLRCLGHLERVSEQKRAALRTVLPMRNAEAIRAALK